MPETGIVCAGRRGNMMGNGAARLFAPRKATLLASWATTFSQEIPLWRGMTRRLRRRSRACQLSCGTHLLRRRSEGGAGGRAESHPACIDRRQLCRKQIPLAGIDAPTPARIGTGRPMGRSHFSFGGERKVCKRKPAARRLREKALYCPFLKEGVRNVARSTVGLPT